MTLTASPKSLAAVCFALAVLSLVAVWLVGSSPARPSVVTADSAGVIAIPAPPSHTPGEVITLGPLESGKRDTALPTVEVSSGGARKARPKTLAAAMAQPQLIGRVLDAEGQPIDGADCLFSTERDFMSQQAQLGTEAGFEPSVGKGVIRWVTEAAGEIRVSARPPTVPGKDLDERAKVTLQPGRPLTGFIRRPGFVPLRLEGQVVSAFRPHDLGDLVMQRGAAIRGIVLSRLGEPIPGVRLTLQQSMARGVIVWETPGRGLDLGVTDEEGRFACSELRVGAFKLIVEAPSASTVVYEGVAQHSSHVAEIKIRVGAGAVLHGRVLDAPDGRRMAVEARGAPDDVPGAGGRPRFGLVNPDDGSFTIQGLTPSRPVWLQAVETAPFGRRASGDAVREVKPVEAFPGRTDEVLLTWKALTGAYGRVVAPAPGGGGVVPVESFVLSSAPSPIREHPFPTQPLLHRGQIQRHYANGRFSFDSKDVGIVGGAPINLRVRAAGFHDLELMGVGLTPHATRDLGDLLLRPAPALRVKVVDAESGDSLSRARVFLASVRWEKELRLALSADRPMWNSAKIFYGETGGRGIAALPTPPSGAPWLLSVCADGYVASEPVSVISTEGEETVSLNRGAVVEVTAVEDSGIPQHAVDVRLTWIERVRPGQAAPRPPVHRKRSTTDRDGKVIFYGVPSGRYKLAAIPPETELRRDTRTDDAPFHWGAQYIHVAAPERLNVELDVPAFVDFEGRVTADRRPVEGARVTLEVEDLRRYWDHPPAPGGPKLQAVSDADGRFRFVRVPSHRYRALVSHPSRAMVMPYKLRVRPGMASPVFPLPQTLIEGQVLLDTTGLPIEGAEVTIRAEGLPAAQLGSARRVEGRLGNVEMESSAVRPGTLVTDSSGWFEFAGVASGVPLVLDVKKPGHEPFSTRVKAVGRLTNYREVHARMKEQPKAAPPGK